MPEKSIDQILEEAKIWFRDSLIESHRRNTAKLVDPDKFNINPFLVNYLANYLTGNSSAVSIAKVLIYPRVLGQSISTSFGQKLQAFISGPLDAFGSAVEGIDIEFRDKIDSRYKYCQLKAGPNTINSDTAKVIVRHFGESKRRARTNSNNALVLSDMIVGVFYGESSDLSSHYKTIEEEHHHPVYVGREFWHRLTGEEEFYAKLIHAFISIVDDIDFSSELNEVIAKLAQTSTIKKIAAKNPNKSS